MTSDKKVDQPIWMSLADPLHGFLLPELPVFPSQRNRYFHSKEINISHPKKIYISVSKKFIFPSQINTYFHAEEINCFIQRNTHMIKRWTSSHLQPLYMGFCCQSALYFYSICISRKKLQVLRNV